LACVVLLLVDRAGIGRTGAVAQQQLTQRKSGERIEGVARAARTDASAGELAAPVCNRFGVNAG
jgi:hypothetical protein